MASKLEELRAKKTQLKNEVSKMEELLSFEDTKKSLSAFTNGFTDQFLTEKTDHLGNKKLAIKPMETLSFVTGGLADKYLKEVPSEEGGTKLGIKTGPAASGLAENAMKLGLAAYASKSARKHLKSDDWRSKLIGLALVYLLPIGLRFIREKLDDFSRRQATKSVEQLI